MTRRRRLDFTGYRAVTSAPKAIGEDTDWSRCWSAVLDRIDPAITRIKQQHPKAENRFWYDADPAVIEAVAREVVAAARTAPAGTAASYFKD